MSKLVISGIHSISPLGATAEAVRAAYEAGRSVIKIVEIGGELVPVAPISLEGESALEALIKECPRYRELDRTVLLAIVAARGAFKASKLGEGSRLTGISVGSSRGATQLLEQSFSAFVRSGKVPTPTSPVTTLGNISSWVAQDLMVSGFTMSHSVTCSTGLHAIVNAVAWIKSGLCDHVIAGASEAALTPFTIAQMKALRIYSRDLKSPYPCRPLRSDAQEVQDGLVLGEGAALSVVESKESALKRGLDASSFVELSGIGYAMEPIESATGITENGVGFERAMRQAIESSGSEEVDCVIAHAPGTAKGDRAEIEAIGRTFTTQTPAILSNKWITGHTFAAAGMINLELASLLLSGMAAPKLPYSTSVNNTVTQPIRRVMINAAGFGGNAVSLILQKDS